MLAQQLIFNSFPTLNLYDKAGFALQLMDEYDVQHLPIISNEKYVGLVSKEMLLDLDEQSILAVLQDSYLNIKINGNAFFMEALKLFAQYEISVLPILNTEHEIIGCVTNNQMLSSLNKYLDAEEPGAIIVLEVEKRHYSFGEITRLVETNDAYITQLNTWFDKETGLTTVTLKINKLELSDIIATFQRYDYTVKYYFGEEQYANELKENYNHLMAYLNI